ncbi:zf-HC2 domain-containing protein [Numidum massiliense]|uniref:zf-HC2 domain-containing protein n=1 Tax=Numidum massiliense TaxID=1522315 RepID=UPI0006D56E2A|nr:zf-HC2 domain-containing protein [Numidum massiliense]
MDCHTSRSHMHDYFDSDAPEDEQNELREHLRECAHCRQLFQQFDRTETLLAADGAVAAPADFTAKLLRKLPRQAAAEGSPQYAQPLPTAGEGLQHREGERARRAKPETGEQTGSEERQRPFMRDVASSDDARPASERVANKDPRHQPRPPQQKRGAGWSDRLRKHPFLVAAALFFILMGASLVSSAWQSQGKFSVTTSPKNLAAIEFDNEKQVVRVKEGEVVEGDLVVNGGKVEVYGEVTGDVVAVDGEVFLASTANIYGKNEQIDRIVDWIWFETAQFFSKLFQ